MKYQLVCIGEEAGQLAEETKALRPEIPWSEIKGMRNLLTHEYVHIDIDIVWQVVDVHVEPLRIACEAIRDQL